MAYSSRLGGRTAGTPSPGDPRQPGKGPPLGRPALNQPGPRGSRTGRGRRSAGSVRRVLGLPDPIRACLFDLDGVLTRTATVHFAAWKRTFDAFLRVHDPAQPEFTQADYNAYVDGKPRHDGVRDFLASRGITLPEGTPDDPGDAATVAGVATSKNEQVLAELAEHGVEVYPGSMRYL